MKEAGVAAYTMRGNRKFFVRLKCSALEERYEGPLQRKGLPSRAGLAACKGSSHHLWRRAGAPLPAAHPALPPPRLPNRRPGAT